MGVRYLIQKVTLLLLLSYTKNSNGFKTALVLDFILQILSYFTDHLILHLSWGKVIFSFTDSSVISQLIW